MKLLRILVILSFVIQLHGECIEDIEVEIWNECYNIENTVSLQNPMENPSQFPESICNLINLEILDFDVMFGHP